MSEDLFTLVRKKKWDHAIQRAGLFPEEASASFSFTFRNGITINTLPLHLACMYQAPLRAVLSLVAADPSICDVIDGIGRTPLHNAVRYGASFKVVSILVSCSRKSIFAKAFDGSFPIHLACSHSTSLLEGVLIVKLLLWIYPESVLIRNSDGLFPRDCVVSNSNGSLRRELTGLLDSAENKFMSCLTVDDNVDERRNDDSAGSSRSYSTASNGDCRSSSTNISVTNEEMIAGTAFVDKKEKTKTENTECVICLERNASVLLIPCGHPCICEECSLPDTMDKIKWSCPVCRSNITQTAKFFGRIVVDERGIE